MLPSWLPLGITAAAIAANLVGLVLEIRKLLRRK